MAVNSAFSEEILADKLAKLNNTQQCIETLSHWCIYHRKDAELIVQTWDRQFRSSGKEQKIPFLYLANDILQNSKRNGTQFVEEFWKVLPGALKDVTENGDDRGKKVVSRLVDIWQDRRVFGSRAGGIKDAILGTAPLPVLDMTKKRSHSSGIKIVKRDSRSVKLRLGVGGTAERIVSALHTVFTNTTTTTTTTMSPPDPIETPSPPAMDSALPAAVVATILSRLDVRSLLAASAACRCLRSCASHALSFLPSFHLLEVALTYDLLRPLLPPNPSLRSLRLDCTRLEDAAISCLARPGLHELLLLNCENISGRLLRELGATCRDLRVLSLNSLAERRGLPISFSDLEELLNGCSQLESLSLALDFSMFDDPNFSHVWASASEGLSSLEIGYIPITMLLELLTAAMESRQCMNHVKTPAFFPSLQKLCLSVDFITNHLIASISTALPSLTHLDLQDAPIIEPTSSSDLTNAGLQKINPNGKLKHISLMRSQEFLFTSFRRVDDLGILLIAEKCSNLESVCLGGFSRVTDTGFRAIIHSCSGLHKLRVSHGSQLTDLVFHDIIATSLCLTHVSLRWCNLLTDVGIERLSFNKDLNVLDLRDCRSLGDEAVRALSCLPKLQTLLLDGTNISDRALKYLGLGKCPLASLSLRGCRKLTNDCIPSLFAGSVKQSLQVLDLSRIPGITNDGIMLIARSRTPLIELRMRENPKIGDAAVMALASMQVDGGTYGSSLQLLDLYDCGGITPLAIRCFKKPYFPRLRWLGVTGSLNRVMVDALVRSRPFLHMACRGEELGTIYWDTSSDWYRHDDDDLDELEQWLLDGEPVSDAETITEE